MSDVPNITQNFGRPSYRPVASSGVLDSDMRRMAVVAAGIGGAIALVIGMFSFSHHVHHGIPIILAEPGPVRVKPADPGGMKVAGAEDLSTGAEMLAPEPEKPALRALRAKAPKPAPMVAATKSSMMVAAANPPAAPPVIAATPAPQRASATEILPAADEPAGTAVQLAAFDNQASAEQDWGKLAEKIPGLFNGHTPRVERATVAGHTVYRLRTGGFANLAAATVFCGKVRAKGEDCSIAAF